MYEGARCATTQGINKERSAVFSCLSMGHKVGQCTSSRRCRNCNRRHHQAILLQTAKAWACDVNGQTVPVRVMLDGGSQRSYITNDLKTRLGLKPMQVEIILPVSCMDSAMPQRRHLQQWLTYEWQLI